MNYRERKNILIAIAISLLLHVLLFLLLFALGITLESPPAVQAKPIVLEFEQPPQAQIPPPQPEAEQQPLAEEWYQIEENPNANEQKPAENTNILAEKSSQSAAPLQSEREISSINPNTILPDYTKDPAKPQQAPEPQSAEDLGIKLDDHSGMVPVYQNKAFSKNLLTKQEDARKKQTDAEASEAPQLPASLKEIRGDLIGEIALSTTAWPWAPWVLDLKQRFYRLLVVPTAYWEGLIDGHTDVWLKVDRKGNLVEHKLLRYDGHETLMESTVHAFTASAPYKALPADFPDEYLELRVRVIYPNIKELYLKMQREQSARQ